MRGARGFTLIELVVVMAILGFLFAILIGITRSVVTQQRYQTTRARMANIDTALAVFVSTNKRLPCPADGRTASSASGAGTEAVTIAGGLHTGCTNNQQYGVIPWATLGLTATDAEDGWGQRFTYRAGPDLIKDTGMDFTNCDPAGGTGIAPTSPPFCSNTVCTSSTLSACITPLSALAGSQTKGLLVTNINGPAAAADVLMDPRSNPSTGAAYAVISHGPEGGGGYTGDGVWQTSTVSAGSAEQMNFADKSWGALPGSYLVDDVINGTASSHFDDIVSRPAILTLAVKAQVGPRSH